jgi:hypothetical protein
LLVSLSISMAVNPTLRVLRVKDGSLLGSEAREVIKRMLKEKDFQLWMETVADENEGIGIYIEEGEVAGA